MLMVKSYQPQHYKALGLKLIETDKKQHLKCESKNLNMHKRVKKNKLFLL